MTGARTNTSTALEQVRAVGDAVLYEGYLLYPYRASASKNRFRWQWGVLMPPGFADEGSGEYAHAGTECLLEPRKHTSLHIRLRFLHAQTRTVQNGSGGDYRDVDSLTVAGTEYTSWDEAVEREEDVVLPVGELLAQTVEVPIRVPGDESVEHLSDAARLLRTTCALTGVLRARLHPLEGPFGGARLHLEVCNTTDAGRNCDTREEALRAAFLATHVLLAVDSGHFLSMQNPPEWARPAAERCGNKRMWPVLLGDNERAPTVLCSPIILNDHPRIAPESGGELFDGTEIDEILTLRTMSLTDEEKREARSTDPKAAEIIDRTDNMPAELLDRLHGTVRYLRDVTGEPADDRETSPVDITAPPDVPWWDPGADSSVSPESDTVVVDGVAVGNGSPVTLRPGSRRADAQDMFLAGRTATVRAVLFDVDGAVYLAVTVDDDPAAELQDTHGRYRYFGPDEVEPHANTEVGS